MTHDLRNKSAGSGTGSVRLHERSILIDGAAKLVLAGEVHYFRLSPGVWNDRLQRLQDNGLDTVSTYIPWLWHELPDGSVDLTGTTHPQRNLVAFLDLCASRGLKIIARPGPFVMAELKNEGIPFRLYKSPYSRPVTWNGVTVPTHTLDYLAPDFLQAARAWYAKVMPVLAARLKTRGGPVIAVQLDNEIGMLSWVSNSPDLTDLVCEEMRLWCLIRYGRERASERVGADSANPSAWAAALRSPGSASLPLHHDLGLYMRIRYCRYVQQLRLYAEENGVFNVPFLINVHGTGGGRGRTFPIGISQLFESYQGKEQMTAGSDLYLGDLTVANVADLYLANAFMLSVLGRHQPLTSLEFEAGNGDYGEDGGNLYSPEAIVLKTMLCVAQGNRALNYYLHAGGENPPMPGAGDGIDRLAFTGQRHGFAAPVGPDGKLNATYAPLGRVVKSLRSMEPLLADAQEEHDRVAIGFVPDHWLSEYHYPASEERSAQIADLERFRGSGPRDILARALLFGGFSFPAVNLQAGVPTVPALVLATGRTLGADVQRDLVAYLKGGGKLLLVGLLPDQDDDGAPCTVLADALKLKSAGRVYDATGPQGQYWPSVAAHAWLSPRPEVRVSVAQLLASQSGEELKPLLTEIASGQACAVEVWLGKGQMIMLGCDYPADLDFYKALMNRLGVKPRFGLNADGPGIVITSTRSGSGKRLLHVLNVAPQRVSFKLHHHGKKLLNGKKLTLGARSGMILPLGVSLNDASIVESTLEIMHLGRSSITMRPTQEKDVCVLRTRKRVFCKAGKVTRNGSRVRVVIERSKHGDRPVTITFR